MFRVQRRLDGIHTALRVPSHPVLAVLDILDIAFGGVYSTEGIFSPLRDVVPSMLLQP